MHSKARAAGSKCSWSEAVQRECCSSNQVRDSMADAACMMLRRIGTAATSGLSYSVHINLKWCFTLC